MKNKNPEKQQTATPRFILPLFAIVVFLAIIFLLYKKYSENNNYRVIKVTGVSTVSNLSKLELFDYNSLANDSACYALAENGDLLSMDNVLYQVSESTGDFLEVSIKEDTATYINGHLYTVIVNDKIDLVPFLKSLGNKEIKSLVNLEFKTIIPKVYLPYLKNIASINKEVSLYFDDDSSSIILSDYFFNANYFNPKVLSANISASFYPQIASLTNITTLFISIEDSITLPLPALPNLKNCILIDAGKMGSPMVMENNRNASYLFADTEVFSNQDLRKFKRLPTLGIHIYDSAALEGLDDIIGNTSTLYISSDSDVITRKLGKFSNVKWLILDGNMLPAAFSNTLAYFQNIRVLEIRANPALTDYKILGELHNLHALIIRDTLTDFNGLLSLKNLKYLSLPETNYSDSLKLNSLEKALPGCIIAPNGGACLGSGWLLLIPFILLFKFYFSRKILHPKIH
jgi:hypothetical protein